MTSSPVNIHVYYGKIFGTTQAGLDFVNGPNVSTLIQGSLSVVMICIQGKHFLVRVKMVGVER